MDQNFIVFLICMGAGLVLVLGGMYLLYAQRFVRSSDGTIEMELPFIGRVKTNYPSLAAIFLGALLLLYPLNRWQQVWIGPFASLRSSAAVTRNNVAIFNN